MKLNNSYSTSFSIAENDFDRYPSESWQEIIGGTAIALASLVLIWATL